MQADRHQEFIIDHMRRSQEHYMRMFGNATVESVAKPPKEYPIQKLRDEVAAQINRDYDGKSLQFRVFWGVDRLATALVKRGPAGGVLRGLWTDTRFRKHMHESDDTSAASRGIEVARKCIESGAVLCFAPVLGHVEPIDAELVTSNTEFDKPLFRLPTDVRTGTAAEVIRQDKPEIDLATLCFVLFEEAAHIIKPAASHVSQSVRSDEGARGHDPSAKPMRGFKLLDRPHVEKAKAMFEKGEVSTPREAARIVAEELCRNGDDYTGRYPGNSEQAIFERIYRQLLKVVTRPGH